MKGVVFNLLEQAVSAQHGPGTWDHLLDTADVAGAYTSLGSYDDQELERLVGAACTALSIDRRAALRWFGRAAMPELASRYPVFFAPHRSGRTFVLDLNSVVHAEVRKLYVGAGCPRFDIRQSGDGVTMGYHSPRRMCALAHGFLEGLADHFGEQVDVDHQSCRDRGDAHCTLHTTWQPAV